MNLTLRWGVIMQLIVIIDHFTDLEQREDEAKTERGNDEMAAKNLQAEVRIFSCRLTKIISKRRTLVLLVVRYK